jgi:hypothetical protein
MYSLFSVCWAIIQPSGLVRIWKANCKAKGANRNAISNDDMMAVFRDISDRLVGLTDDERATAAEAAPLILDAETTRRQGLETKAAAALAASGLIAAGLAVVIVNDGWVRYLSLGALLYLLSAAWAALYALTPASRHVISAESAFEKNPTAEILTIVKVNEEPTLAVSNLATASLYDNARAGAILVLALTLSVIWPSNPAPVVSCPSARPVVSCTNTPVVPRPNVPTTYRSMRARPERVAVRRDPRPGEACRSVLADAGQGPRPVTRDQNSMSC